MPETGSLHFGVDLGRCNPARWAEVAVAADELGFESLWIAEHLVLPARIEGSPGDDAHVTVDPHLPLFDPFVMLASLAAVTTRIHLGTNVYNIGLRHPFVTARAAATLDIVSQGRLVLGIGASWLEGEWRATELDFSRRGARVDESIALCRRLWTEPVVAHEGEFFRFDAVVFEPKPVQASIPIHVGGESRRALRRVAELGDGWIGMLHDPPAFAADVDELRRMCDARGRDAAQIERTALAPRPDATTIEAWRDAGATRLIVAPWARSAEAVDGLERFAAEHGTGRR